MSCCMMARLKSDLQMAEIEAKQKYSARRSFLETSSEAAANDANLIAFMEDKIVEAEMSITRAIMTIDQHRQNCLFCSPSNLN
jgi:hypothetical protein